MQVSLLYASNSMKDVLLKSSLEAMAAGSDGKLKVTRMLLKIPTLHSFTCLAMLRELLGALEKGLVASAAAQWPSPFSQVVHATWLLGVAWKSHSHITLAGTFKE